jgi:hypothetical protein
MRNERLLLALVLAGAVSCKGSAGNASTGTATGSAPAASGGSGTAAAAPGAGTASAAPAPPAPPAPAPAGGKPIRASLIEAAGGKPVLLALDGKGQLVARTVDGGLSRVLLAGPYGDAAPDADRDLVWLRDDHKLDVLDLRGAAPAPITLVTFPDKAMQQLGEHITEPPRWTMDGFVAITLGSPCGKGAGLRLDWSHDGESTQGFAKGFRAVARDWFTAQEHRARQPLDPDPYPARAAKHKVPRKVGTCATDAKEEFGKDRCGTAAPFGATGVDLVVVGASSEHCPGSHCQLYDPKAKKFTPVPGLDATDDAAPSCGPFRFDRAGTSFLVGDQACGPDLTCRSVGVLAIGWLEGNRVVDKQ